MDKRLSSQVSSMRDLTLEPDGSARAALEEDLAGKTSVLELLKSYMEELRHSADNLAPAFGKLGTLFRLGLTPPAMEGHFYGVPLGLRLTGERHALSQVDNVIGLLWGVTLEDECPWVGKTLRQMDRSTLGTLVPSAAVGEPAYLGINHFHRLGGHPLNTVAFQALSVWLDFVASPEAEQRSYGHERDAGSFIASRAPSVYAGTPRDVFSLNYRWKSLHNRPPLSWLVDEMVQIAEGLYLGQLLFATSHLFEAYDPAAPVPEHHYQHMGYFVLWGARWNPEGRRLFPYLEIPVTAPGVAPEPIPLTGASRFATLKLETPAPAICDDRVFAEVQQDLAGQQSVMHLMKHYSDILQDSLDNESPYFPRLRELFNRGAVVREMNGFYRGGLVTWRGEGLFKLFDANALNLAWKGFAGRFSTWTGKSFETGPERLEQIREITGGHETGAVPTFWGANTQALRTMKEREVGRLMKLANIWSEPVSGEEALANGYDLKNFFFVARQAESVNDDCCGKRIFQFNYRWPKLRTILPDCLCIDEIVEIAEGLFLGQLMYATNVVKPYDPRVPPVEYRYGMFGYFLLMNEEWHRIRLQIGFDLDNV